jgi:hypothetical protein
MESEYRFQLTGFGFWIGYLSALGVKIVLYNSIFDAPMYGYEGDVAIESTQFEKRITELIAELGDERDHYNKDAKSFIESLSGLLSQDISKSIQEQLKELTKRAERVGIINGRIKENLRYLEEAKAMVGLAGVSVFSMGVIESIRISHNKQYYQVRAEAISLNAQINPLLSRLLLLKKRTQKRQRALNEFGSKLAELINKNMLLFHIVGAIKENQYYIDSIKLSYRVIKEGDH